MKYDTQMQKGYDIASTESLFQRTVWGLGILSKYLNSKNFDNGVIVERWITEEGDEISFIVSLGTLPVDNTKRIMEFMSEFAVFELSPDCYNELDFENAVDESASLVCPWWNGIDTTCEACQ